MQTAVSLKKLAAWAVFYDWSDIAMATYLPGRLSWHENENAAR